MKRIALFFFILFLISNLAVYSTDFVIYLNSAEKSARTHIISLFQDNLEPFYPIETEEFKDIFLVSDNSKGREIIEYIRQYDSINIEKARYYKFQKAFLPNDPYLNQQYVLSLCNFYEAWDITIGDENIIIGVVDSGIDYNHEDLHERIWINEGEIPGNGIDDDNNGFIDDYMGWNFVSADPDDVYEGENPGPNNDPMDFSGHGTAVSGILGAMTNNNIGIAGASHESRIMAIKSGYVNSEGLGVLKDVDAARGIVYAALNGANIINISWGDIEESEIIKKAIDLAVNRDVIVIAAGGNSGERGLFFPASMESVISVGSLSPDGSRSGYSNYSIDLDIYVYGEDILTTGMHNSYTHATGTSFACAYATGAAVLIKSRFPNFSNEMIRGQIVSTASGTGSFHDSPYTGTLDMLNALRSLPVSNIVLADYQFFNTNDMDYPVQPGEDTSLTISLKNLWRQSAPHMSRISSHESDMFIYQSVINLPSIDTYEIYKNTEDPFLLHFNEDFYFGRRAKIDLYLFRKYSGHISFPRHFPINFVMPYPQNTGFPFSSGRAIVTSPLAIDINDNNKKEIFFGNYSGLFYGIDHQGNILDGFPIESEWPFVSSPAYAELDNDGKYYIIFGGFDSNLYVIDSEGNDKEGFPVALNGPVYGSTPVGKLNGCETYYIVVATLNGKLYAIDSSGNIKPGFPVNIPMSSYATPAIASFNQGQTLSIIIGGANGGLYVFNNNGFLRPNFPIFAESYIFSSPAVADIDNNGSMDIIFASYDRKLYVTDSFGNSKSGFPVYLEGPVFSSPAVFDINNDGYLNIIIGSGNPANKLWALNHAGEVLSGFPIISDHAFSSSPAIYDIDGDGYADIAIGSYSQEIFIIKHTGETFLGFPYPTGAEILSSPTFGDFDNDGDIDLIYGDHNGMLHILDLQFQKTSPVKDYWFTFRGNYHRTGSK